MIYFIPISCIQNNLLNTFKCENEFFFFFNVFFIFKIAYQILLNMKMYLFFFFFFLHSRFECKVNTEKKKRKVNAPLIKPNRTLNSFLHTPKKKA